MARRTCGKRPFYKERRAANSIEAPITPGVIIGVRWNAMKRNVSNEGIFANGRLAACAEKPILVLKVISPLQ